MKTEKTAVFYFSLRDGHGRQPITLLNGRVVFVRVGRVTSRTVGDALDLAAPRRDEVVMNSHVVVEEGER